MSTVNPIHVAYFVKLQKLARMVVPNLGSGQALSNEYTLCGYAPAGADSLIDAEGAAVGLTASDAAGLTDLLTKIETFIAANQADFAILVKAAR